MDQKQADLQEQVSPTKDASPQIPIATSLNKRFARVQTSNQYYEEESSRRQKDAVKGILGLSGGVAGAFWLYRRYNRNFKYDPKTLNYQNYNLVRLGDQLKSYLPEANLGDKITNSLRAMEDMSPGQIFRTFNLSTTLAPFLASKNYKFKISPYDVKNQAEYWEKHLAARGNMELNATHRQFGFQFEDNALYEIIDKEGTKGRKVLEHAVIEFPQFRTPKELTDNGIKYTTFENKPFRKMLDMFKVAPDYDVNEIGITVRGAKTRFDIISDSVRANVRLAIERGARVFDKPGESLKELFPNLEGWDMPKGLKTTLGAVGKVLNPILEPGLGTEGVYNLSSREMLKRMSMNIARKGTILFGGYYALDKAARSLSGDEDDLFHEGLASGGAKLYAGTRIAYASIISDRTQGLRDTQESVAPGSTKISTLIGAPMSLALGGAMLSYGIFLRDVAKKGIAEANYAAETKVALPFLKRAGKEIMMTRGRRYAAIGAMIGGAIVSPFLPGALLTGDTSAELKAEYYDGKEVAVRSNRFWETGGYDWEGGKIKYFSKSFIYRTIKNYKEASRGGQELRDETNPFLNPFDYLRDPYAREKALNEERPYPVWGMDMSEFSFFGKAFEKTVGQLIKPDRINPSLMENVAQQDDGTFSYDYVVQKGDAGLINEGALIPDQSGRYDPKSEAAIWSYGAAKDFIGLKGFMIQNLETALGIDSSEIENMQLARSGEMDNASRDIKELNAGGMLTAGEGLRRIVPTNSGSIVERFSNMPNNMPSWLPRGEESNFYVDFSTGDPYRKIELGEARLPGKGYEKLHSEVRGMSPEEYPEIYKYKILSDVGLGSKEYYQYKNKFDALSEQGALEGREAEIYQTIKDQERHRSEGKQFFEYKTDAEMGQHSFLGQFLARYWELVSHNADAPWEKLSPVRPGSKFLSQRTAIEDYEKTQVYTGDTAMWSKPIEHYVSPLFTQMFRMTGVNYVPDSTKDRYNIDEYFDKLQYLKYRKLYTEAVDNGDLGRASDFHKKYEQTLQGALTTGLDTKAEIVNAFIALPKRERDYFGSFFVADDEERQKIKSLVPERVGALYEQVWNRKDIFEANTTEDGLIDFDAAAVDIQQQIGQEDAELRESYPQLARDYDKVRNKASTNFREYLADAEAGAYVEGTTGIPDSDFVGWDPRIDLDAVKLRTLSVGKDDIYEYGFFKSDEQDLEKLIAVLQDDKVTTKSIAIKENIKKQKLTEEDIRSILQKQGINVQSISTNQSIYDSGSMTLNLQENDT